MSFSSNVKSELSHHFGSARHCNIAELAAIINMCGEISCINNNFCITEANRIIFSDEIYNLYYFDIAPSHMTIFVGYFNAQPLFKWGRGVFGVSKIIASCYSV